MSMMHLLSAGKSLVGLNGEGKRYRQPDPRAMPKFGSGKNVFRSKAGARDQSGKATDPGKARSECVGTGEALPEKTEPVTKPESGLVEAPLRSGSLTSAFARASKARWPEGEARKQVSWLGKLAAWLPVGGGTGKRPRVTRLAPPPVQGELSLDNVKVLRNDLSDADLEVVAAKPKPAEGQQEPIVAVAATKSVRPKAWDRVATMLGAGRT